MELTNSNYHSLESNQATMSTSQYKDFLKCESMALAKIQGDFVQETTDALLIGSFVDDYFSGEITDNPKYYTKSGTLLAKYQTGFRVTKRIEEVEAFQKITALDTQKILTGEINGVPFRVKPDFLSPSGKIFDLKVMRDTNPVWSDDMQCKVSFILAYGYHYQGAIYSEIVRQNGIKDPSFYLFGATKEKSPDVFFYKLPQEILTPVLYEIEDKVGRFQKIKLGEILPESCGVCDYCKSKKTIKLPTIWGGE